MKSKNAIQINNLSKVYQLRQARLDENGNETYEHLALNNISFEIKRGESVGIVGPNGSGKSTLLKILAGVTKPTLGNITIHGKVASILEIGAGFHPELSGLENVFLNGQILGFSKKEIQNKYDEIVSFSGIGKFIEEPVKNYSSGMYLRLAFSIMAHLDFDVYLFDEVLSVGDADFAMKTKQKIANIIRKKKTVLLISHQLYELEGFDKIIRLENGKLKHIPNQENALSLYTEDVLKENHINIHQQNVIINTFDVFNGYDDVKLIAFELFQDSDCFRSDKRMNFMITYQKLTELETFDIILVVKDVNDQSVFTSSPIASGHFNMNNKKGTYRYTCEIPAFFLFEATYKVSVRFVKNTEFLVLQKHEDDSIYNDEHVLFDLNRFFNNILYFKTVFKIEDEAILLQPIYFQQKLFLGNNWKQDIINEL